MKQNLADQGTIYIYIYIYIINYCFTEIKLIYVYAYLLIEKHQILMVLLKYQKENESMVQLTTMRDNAYGQILLKEPVPCRSLEISCSESIQYYNL